jgi:hypothetical protein
MTDSPKTNPAEATAVPPAANDAASAAAPIVKAVEKHDSVMPPAADAAVKK